MTNEKNWYAELNTEADIDALVAKEQEETQTLDFKEATDNNGTGTVKGDRKVFAKALSGFSNASGGVIVWGVSAKNGPNPKTDPDVANATVPIKNVKKFLTDLNTDIHSIIDSSPIGVENKIIEASNSEEGYVVTHIPLSNHRPHKTTVGEYTYYLRSGSSTVHMPHSVVMDMVKRTQSPRLSISLGSYQASTRPNDWSYGLNFTIKNEGQTIVFNYAMHFMLPSFFGRSGGVDGAVAAHDNNGFFIWKRKFINLPIFPSAEDGFATHIRFTVRKANPSEFDDHIMKWKLFAENMNMMEGETTVGEFRAGRVNM